MKPLLRYLILLLMLSQFTVFGQHPEIPLDSLMDRITENRLKDLNQNLAWSNLGIKKSKEKKNEIYQAKFLYQKGLALYFLGSYDSASIYYYKSLDISEKKGAKILAAHILNDLGKLFRKLKQYPEALKFYDRAQTYFEEEKDLEGRAIILNESGIVYELTGNYDEALRRYRASLAIQQQRRDTVGIGYSTEFIGIIYMLKNDLPAAEKYFRQALEFRRAARDSFALALNLNQLGELTRRQNRMQDALTYYHDSHQLATANGYTDLKATNLKALSEILEESGDFRNSLIYLKQFEKLNDSLFDLKKNQQINELTQKYQAAEKDNLILQQENSLKTRKSLILGIIGLAAFVLTGLWYFLQNKRKNESIQHQNEMLAEQEKSALAVIETEDSERQHMSMYLHDNVGQLLTAARMNLNALEDLDDTNARDKIFNRLHTILKDSQSEVREISHAIMPKKLMEKPLKQALLELIEQYEFSGIQINLSYPDQLPDPETHSKISLYRIIQECISNTVKYARANEINIEVGEIQSDMEVVYRDNGHGFELLQLNGKGMGIQNLFRRIELLKGSVSISSDENSGTSIKVRVPLKTHADYA